MIAVTSDAEAMIALLFPHANSYSFVSAHGVIYAMIAKVEGHKKSGHDFGSCPLEADMIEESCLFTWSLLIGVS